MSLMRWLINWLRPRRADPLAALAGAPPEVIRVVVGLGNPGAQYQATRHNVGYLAVDLLAGELGLTWLDDSARTRSLIAAGQLEGVAWTLCKPQTFMNRSGEAVARLLSASGTGPHQAMVIYDDLDLPYGALRVRQSGSAGTHNGMRSVLQALQTHSIARIRIGIGGSPSGNAIEHVLGEFSADERAALPTVITRAAAAAKLWATEGAAAAMNHYNNR